MKIFQSKKNIIIMTSVVVVVIASMITYIALGKSSNDMDDAIKIVDEYLLDRGFEHGDLMKVPKNHLDVQIEWESSDSTIENSGNVNTIGLLEDIEVTISVTFTEGDEVVYKTYYVNVYHINSDYQHPDERKLESVIAELELPFETETNIVLPEEVDGVVIEWSSNNIQITSDGVVTRTNNDVLVTLTATFSNGDFIQSKEYQILVIKELTVSTLQSPMINLNTEDNIITWNPITNAEGYKVVIGTQEYNIIGTQFDLSNAEFTEGNHTIYVIATSSDELFNDSDNSNAVTYNYVPPVQRVDASGLLFQVNIGGHYSIENPAHYNPDGWSEGEYLVRLYQNDTLLDEQTFNNTSPVVHIQVPGQNGMLSGRPAGEYTVHVIMIGNGTTHADSEPKIFTFQYQG